MKTHSLRVSDPCPKGLGNRPERQRENGGTENRRDGSPTPRRCHLFVHSLNYSTDVYRAPATHPHWVGGTEPSPPSLRRLGPPAAGLPMACPPLTQSVSHPRSFPFAWGEREAVRHPPSLPAHRPCQQVLLDFHSFARFPSPGKGRGSCTGLAGGSPSSAAGPPLPPCQTVIPQDARWPLPLVPLPSTICSIPPLPSLHLWPPLPSLFSSLVQS